MEGIVYVLRPFVLDLLVHVGIGDLGSLELLELILHRMEIVNEDRIGIKFLPILHLQSITQTFNFFVYILHKLLFLLFRCLGLLGRGKGKSEERSRYE